MSVVGPEVEAAAAAARSLCLWDLVVRREKYIHAWRQLQFRHRDFEIEEIHEIANLTACSHTDVV